MIKFAFVFLVALTLVGLGYFLYLGRASQSGKAPGLISGRLAPCPATPNCVSSDETTDPGQEIEAFSFNAKAVTSPEAWTRLQDIVSVTHGVRVIEVSDEYLSAECSSQLFGFVDDLEFHLRPESSIIAVRSASRVGHSDMGANRKRVEALRVSFEASLAR